MKSILLHIIVFFSCVCIVGCKSNTTPPPTVKNGQIDLSQWNFEGNRILKLNGEWEFYWNTLADPTQFGKSQVKLPKSQFVKVPSTWTNYEVEGKNLPPHGYATYCVRIKLPKPTNMRLGIFIPKIWSATKVWVNDDLIHTSGIIAKDYANYENRILETLVEIEPKQQEVHLVIQVANHDIFVAGLMQPFKIGYYGELLESTSLQYSWTMMWLGILLAMGLYHFVLFSFRRKNKSTLYFGIISILIAIRLIVFGNHYIYEYLTAHSNLFNFAIQSKVYYGTTFWLPPIALLYIQSLFPDKVSFFFNKTIPIVSKKAIRVALIVTTIYTTFILVVSPVIFTSTILFYQPIFGIFIAYLFFAIILAAIKRKQESLFQMLGILTMVLAGGHDAILTFTGNDFLGLGGIELLPLAFSIFLSLQFLIIARRFSRAFLFVEDLSANLEKKVEERTIEVTQKNNEIEKKNEQLQLQNKNITDSIQYAKRIQKAILGSQQRIEEKFKDAFIFLQARDIVSGDFYWYSEATCNQDWLFNDGISSNNGSSHLPMLDIKIVVAADCTGHGVPGAFMTIMGNDLLNEIVNDQCVHKPSMILKQLDKKVRATLQSQSEEKTDDGMDMTVITIDETHQKLYFSGAKNSILLVRRGDVFRLKGSIYPVGSAHYKSNRDYQLHVFETQPDDVIYMFSDGFQDQFGGNQGRKYMTKRFRSFLLSISNLPMQEQKTRIKQEFDAWVTDKYQQTDDVLVMGIRL
ncbi:MAG TPA: hypothetical protein DCS93_06375 [Microscillaceae bacterium]|nr:hypothetical protein [Microscillaceae bacterium]